jgi:hypothetical protein
MSEGYEKRDVSFRAIFWFVVHLVVLAIVAQAGLWLLMRSFERRAERTDATPQPMMRRGLLPPEPRLQISPSEDLRALRDAEQVTLTSYGWVNRDAGIVRLPVERAMELIATNGGTLQ